MDEEELFSIFAGPLIYYFMRNYVLLVVILWLPRLLSAQRLTGSQLSNYAGTNGLYLNPSSIADSRWGTHINLATVSFLAGSQPKLPLVTVPFAQADLKLHGQELAMKQIDLRGPGAMYQLPGGQAIAVTTRYRSDLNLIGDYDLVHWFLGDKTPLETRERSAELLSDTFGEIALSYAISVLDKNHHFLKVGGTYKYMRGLQTTALTTSGRFGASSDQLAYSLNGLQTTYSDLLALSKLKFSDVLFGKVPGVGRGFDIGFTYEFRPLAESFQYAMDGKMFSDAAVTKYKYRVGVSLLDIGNIQYQNASTWSVPPRDGTLQQVEVQPPNTPTLIRDALARSLGIVPEGSIGDLTMKLPQTLSVQADARVTKNWFVGGVWWKPMQPSAVAQHRAELISVGPRYESARLEFSAMINYWQPLGKVSLGTHIRWGKFTLGSDNLLGFVADNGLSTNLFAGVTLSFRAKRPADSDNDHVSNRLDLCPATPGLWAFQGCPDTDNDGVQDKDDECPEVAGPIRTKGCPDTDGDGMLDKNDACPTEAGLASNKGCPDTDGDGIINSNDECPTVAGPIALGGCPDTDADGIRDRDDACPTEWGLNELNGCALKAMARTDSGLVVAEKKLLDQLGSSWLRGPATDTTALSALKTYLSSTPGRQVTLTFVGSNQEQLIRVTDRFKETLGAYFGTTQRFRFKINIKTNEPVVGLVVGITQAP